FVSDIVRAQIRAADLLVVTKAGSVSDSQLTQVHEACTAIAGDVPVETVRNGEWAPILRALVELSSERADGVADGRTDERTDRRAGRSTDGHADGPPVAGS